MPVGARAPSSYFSSMAEIGPGWAAADGRRPLQGAGRAAGRLGRRHPPRLPQARQGAAPRPQPGQSRRRRGAVQEGLGRLRDRRRRRQAQAVRPRRDRCQRRAAPRLTSARMPAAGRSAAAAPAAAGEEFGFGDIFSDLFGAGAAAARRGSPFGARGRDVRYTLEVDFLEAATGAKKRVTHARRRRARPRGAGGRRRRPGAAAEGQGLARPARQRGRRRAGRDQGAPARRSSSASATTSCWSCRSPSTRRCSAPRSRCRPSPAACSSPCPKGTSSGRVFRLKGKGVRNTTTGNTGDQLVTVRIVLPETIDDELVLLHVRNGARSTATTLAVSRLDACCAAACYAILASRRQ